MTCMRISAPGVDLFVCGLPRPTCFSCKSNARTSCAFDGCARPLCEQHARKVGTEHRCAKHAPMTVNENMPKPPPIRR